MAQLVVDDAAITVEMSRWERLGALRREVTQPVAAVVSVQRVDNARKQVKGLRLPGTGVPGKILLGTFVKKHKQFAAAYNNDPGYVITFKGCEYTEVIVSMPASEDIDALG